MEGGPRNALAVVTAIDCIGVPWVRERGDEVDAPMLGSWVRRGAVGDLERIATGFGIEFPGDEYSNDDLLWLCICRFPGPISDEQVRREAAEILSELMEP